MNICELKKFNRYIWSDFRINKFTPLLRHFSLYFFHFFVPWNKKVGYCCPCAKFFEFPKFYPHFDTASTIKHFPLGSICFFFALPQLLFFCHGDEDKFCCHFFSLELPSFIFAYFLLFSFFKTKKNEEEKEIVKI
jgi:hypothetical protein